MRKVFTASFLIDTVLGIFWTCWVASLISEGRSISDACIAAAVWYGCIGLLEVPTGAVADKFGRKISCCLGLVGLGLSFFILSFNPPEPIPYAIFGLAGISSTLISGAREAWFFSEFIALKTGHKEDRFWLNLDLFGRLGMVVGAFVGAGLLSISASYVWLAAGAVCTSSLLLCLSLDESRTRVGEPSISPHLKVPTWGDFKAPILLILMSSVFFGLETGVRNIIYQPFILNLTDNVMFLAYFQSTLAAVRIVGILLYRNWLSKFDRGVTFVTTGLLAFAGAEVVASTATSYWAFLPAYALGVLCLGWALPVKQSIFNSHLNDRSRATMLSVENMVMGLAASIACAGLARFVNGGSVESFWVLGASFLVLSALSFSGTALVKQAPCLEKGLQVLGLWKVKS